MSNAPKLSEEQEMRIAATLARIRGGLNAHKGSPFEEPAHIFVTEAHRAENT